MAEGVDGNAAGVGGTVAVVVHTVSHDPPGPVGVTTFVSLLSPFSGLLTVTE